MRIDEFENRDKQADVAIKLFNDYCGGREFYLDANWRKKGTVVGLNKHLQYKLNEEISESYIDKQFIDFDIIQKVENIIYSVSFKVKNSELPVIISFELFLKSNGMSYSKGPVSTTVRKSELSI